MTIVANDQPVPAEDDRPRSGGGRKSRNRNRKRNRNQGNAQTQRDQGASKTPDELETPESTELVDEAQESVEVDEVEATAESENEDQAEAENEAETEDQADAESETEDQAEAESEIDAESEIEVEVEAESEIDAEDAEPHELDEPAQTEPMTATIAGVATSAAKNNQPPSARKTAPKLASLPSGGGSTDSLWTMSDVLQVCQRALAVLAVLGLVGYGLGFSRGGTSIARTEFVYTLDESVPDSFLREDRRLLTQVVTFTSDAVLAPVADQFETDVDDLRSKVDVETLELSEVLRLQVADADADQALAISAAIIERYLDVTLAAQPAGENADLAASRQAVAEELAVADAARFDLDGRLADLDVRRAAIERRIALENGSVERTQELLADAAARQVDNPVLTAELEAGTDRLADLDQELTIVAEERATAIATAGENLESLSTGGGQSALLREIQRLETKLATIETELAERELAPLVASPIRVLEDPIVIDRSPHLGGLQGMALGLLVGTPIAALVAYRTRQRQLWFG